MLPQAPWTLEEALTSELYPSSSSSSSSSFLSLDIIFIGHHWGTIHLHAVTEERLTLSM